MKPVDAHCHLDFDHFNDDREQVIARSKEQLEFIVCAGSSFENNLEVLKLQEKHPDFIKTNLGIHPTYTEKFDQLEKVKQQIRDRDPVAVGEIGLDHYHVKDEAVRERQRVVFRQLLSLAEELEKPVAVHTREAESEAVEILSEYDLPDVMLHCFNGSPELAEKAVEQGMTIGVSTQVLYSNRVKNIVETINTENMLLETDSPFLYQGDRNEPLHVLESAEKIAEIKDISTEKVVEDTTRNARRFFD